MLHKNRKGLKATSFAASSSNGGTPNQPSTDASLSNMTISAGTLSPSFSSGTHTYTVSEANGVTSVTVTPTVNEAHATIQVRVNSGSYSAVTSGSPSGSLSLNVGDNPIDVLVTAQDGSTTITYTTTATRASSFATTKCLSFNGSDGVVAGSVQAAQSFSTTYSLAVWVKAADNGGVTILDSSFPTRAGGYMIENNTTAGKFGTYGYHSLSGGNYQEWRSSVTAFDSTWHIVAVTFNSGTFKMYVDGTEDTSKVNVVAGSNTDISTNPHQPALGANFFGGVYRNFYGGKLTNVSLWNVCLSGTDVANLASGGKPADLSQHAQFANCVGWYRAGDGDATGANNVLDSSGNGYHMTITNGVTVVADAP